MLINYIKGEIKNINKLVLIANEYFGIFVKLKPSLKYKIKIGQKIELYLYPILKKSFNTDKLEIKYFAFDNLDDFNLFKTLINLKQITDNIALNLVDIGVDNIKLACINNNLDILKKIKGIGNKKAKFIIEQLKLKLNFEKSFSNNNEQIETIKLTLENIGYSKEEIHKALEYFYNSKLIDNNNLSIQNKIKEIIKFLS